MAEGYGEKAMTVRGLIRKLKHPPSKRIAAVRIEFADGDHFATRKHIDGRGVAGDFFHAQAVSIVCVRPWRALVRGADGVIFRVVCQCIGPVVGHISVGVVGGNDASRAVLAGTPNAIDSVRRRGHLYRALIA
jgi:hypothetical protein